MTYPLNPVKFGPYKRFIHRDAQDSVVGCARVFGAHHEPGAHPTAEGRELIRVLFALYVLLILPA